MWLTRSVGRTVGDTYSRVRWLIAENYSRLDDSRCAKVVLHMGGMACEMISLSYSSVSSIIELMFMRIVADLIRTGKRKWTAG